MRDNVSQQGINQKAQDIFRCWGEGRADLFLYLHCCEITTISLQDNKSPYGDIHLTVKRINLHPGNWASLREPPPQYNKGGRSLWRAEQEQSARMMKWSIPWSENAVTGRRWADWLSSVYELNTEYYCASHSWSTHWPCPGAKLFLYDDSPRKVLLLKLKKGRNFNFLRRSHFNTKLPILINYQEVKQRIKR